MVIRNCAAALLTLLFSVSMFSVSMFSVSTASGQQWAQKMLDVTSHDFGVVARGARAEFAFELTNLYEEDVHIAGVRSSCGCATATVSKRTLKTWEKAQVLTVFNTRSFLGHKTGTITVTIDKPYYAEVQLTVQGFIRGDVVFDPGVAEFGEVTQGTTAGKELTVTYGGRSDWQILDVRSANPHFEVELHEHQRRGGRVSYRMAVRLKADAPAGYFQDQLTLVTNDQRMKHISLPVQGRVVPALTINPASLFLGVLQPGQTVTKQLVVRGNAPFRVLDVHCSDGDFEFQAPDKAQKLHFIPLSFTAGPEPGKRSYTIQIETDLAEAGTAQCVATATVKPQGD